MKNKLKGLYKKLSDNKVLIYLIIFVTLVRFMISFSLPSFSIFNLPYDDKLMLFRLTNLLDGKYFGNYNYLTLVKGIIYPLFLYICYITKISYSTMLTILYILSCLYFSFSLKKFVKNKYYILILYVVLLFNPISYSSELFQRLYRNSLSIIEILFFLGLVIRIIYNDKIKIHNYIFLGLIVSIMFLTKEENIWVWLVLGILFIYKVYKNINIKNIIVNLIPVFEIIICLNIVCLVNYNYYKTYTYNELSKSEFKKTYIKMLEIKEDKKIDHVSIQKDTLYKLADNSKLFNISREKIDKIYEAAADENGEINNGNVIWYLKGFTHVYGKFKNGKEANKYYKKLGKEIDELFKKGKLEKEFTIPSLFIYTPTWKDIKKVPGYLIKAIVYTSTYDEIKVITNNNFGNWKYNKKYRSYLLVYRDYHNSANIVKENIAGYEFLRIIYKVLTIILSIPSLFIYIKNIRKKDKINLVLHMLVLIYLLIIGGVVYNHITAFDSLRYCYLGNIYLLQTIFIIINTYRFIDEKIIVVNEVETKDNEISISEVKLEEKKEVKTKTKTSTKNKSNSKSKTTTKGKTKSNTKTK